MQDEIWKDIEGYPLYQVSDLGNVRSFSRRKKGALLALIETHEYLYVTLCNKENYIGKKHAVHRLVIEAFIGEIPKGMDINHKNGTKSDNRLDNLEIVTRLENVRHAIENGLLLPLMGEDHGSSKLTNEQIEEIRAKYIPRVYSQYRLAKEYGVCVMQINRIIHRKRWSHI